MSDGAQSMIVLVEDNPADVYLFRMALQNAGVNFELLVIEDGAEALAFARQGGKYAGNRAPDLIVLDLNLPKNGGVEVLRVMRDNPHFAKAPVVVASSSASPRERADAERLGAARHIVKPPDLDSFLQIGVALKEVLLAHRDGNSSVSPPL